MNTSNTLITLLVDKRPLSDKNGKEYKLIQAGQDWSDSDTWVGLILALLTLAVPLSGLYFRWWN